MPAEKIRILVVDDNESTVEAISLMLKLEKDLEVVGVALEGRSAIEKVAEVRPDVVLMDINMPVMDGIAATEAIIQKHPGTAVVILSGQSDHEYLRRAMNVGASYYLNKPVSSDELYNAVRRSFEVVHLRRERFAQPATPAAPAPQPKNGKIVAFFSPSGGMGRTTIAANIAVALAREGRRTALVDLSLPFGDTGVLLNAPPKAPSIGDLVGKFAQVDGADVESTMYSHRSGLRVLLAPPRPETEEHIGPNDIRILLGLVRSLFDTIIVDTWPTYAETMLVVFDAADTIVVPVTLELTATKNARVFIEVMTKLGLEDKVTIVVNRTDPSGGIKVSDVEGGLGRKVLATLPSDEHALRIAMNRGLPLVETHPESKLAKELAALAKTLAAEPAAKVA